MWLTFIYFRVIRLAGEEGNLTRENFTKILRSSDLFLKAFDKNKDGIVTEVLRTVLRFGSFTDDKYVSTLKGGGGSVLYQPSNTYK